MRTSGSHRSHPQLCASQCLIWVAGRHRITLAMAPKTTTPNKSTMATVVDHEVIQLDDVSLAEDSGWRELDGGRVDELAAML